MNYRTPTMAKKDIGVAPYFYNAWYKLGKHIADNCL